MEQLFQAQPPMTKMKKIKWSEKVINGEVLSLYKRTLLNNILHRKANWIGRTLIRNYLLHDAIEEEEEEEGENI